MLEDAPESPDARKCRRKGPSVLALPEVRIAGLDEPGELAPAGARRMGDHGPRAGVAPRVPGFVPGVDVGQAEVGAALLDEERGDHPARA